MSRYENANTDHMDLPDPNADIDVTYYLKEGVSIAKDQYALLSPPPTICAKAIHNINSNVTNYYLLVNNRNQIFDPRETDSRYKNQLYWKYRKVRGSTFDTYLKFLKQKYRSLLIQAEREL